MPPSAPATIFLCGETVVPHQPIGFVEPVLTPDRNRGFFPLDVNEAEREALLRVPGLGKKSVDRILESRRHRTLRLDDLGRLAASVKRMLPFVIAADYRPAKLADCADLRTRLAPPPEQLALFA